MSVSKISLKNEHDPDIVSDHSTATGTDTVQADGKVKRGIDVNLLNKGLVTVDVEQFERLIAINSSMHDRLEEILYILKSIAEA